VGDSGLARARFETRIEAAPAAGREIGVLGRGICAVCCQAWVVDAVGIAALDVCAAPA